VVERLGGEVGATASPGIGATFWWTLPAEPT
jgi:signal transduction histidine kinase